MKKMKIEESDAGITHLQLPVYKEVVVDQFHNAVGNINSEYSTTFECFDKAALYLGTAETKLIGKALNSKPIPQLIKDIESFEKSYQGSKEETFFSVLIWEEDWNPFMKQWESFEHLGIKKNKFLSKLITMTIANAVANESTQHQLKLMMKESKEYAIEKVEREIEDLTKLLSKQKQKICLYKDAIKRIEEGSKV